MWMCTFIIHCDNYLVSFNCLDFRTRKDSCCWVLSWLGAHFRHRGSEREEERNADEDVCDGSACGVTRWFPERASWALFDAVEEQNPGWTVVQKQAADEEPVGKSCRAWLSVCYHHWWKRSCKWHRSNQKFEERFFLFYFCLILVWFGLVYFVLFYRKLVLFNCTIQLQMHIITTDVSQGVRSPSRRRTSSPSSACGGVTPTPPRHTPTRGTPNKHCHLALLFFLKNFFVFCLNI